MTINHKLRSTLAICLLAISGGCTQSHESGTAAQAEQADAPSQPQPLPRVAKGDIQFVEGYAEGIARARTQNAPMLVFFTAEWCHFCHQMANEAFTNPQVVNLSKQFVCVLVDADRENEVCSQFRVRGFPTIQFVSPRGIPLNRITGKKPGHQLVMEMQAALQTVARRSSPDGTIER